MHNCYPYADPCLFLGGASFLPRYWLHHVRIEGGFGGLEKSERSRGSYANRFTQSSIALNVRGFRGILFFIGSHTIVNLLL